MTAHTNPQRHNETVQVCLNGHLVATYAMSRPESCRPHCPRCGEATTTVCPVCKTPITGQTSTAMPRAHRVPGFCAHCDLPFPWVQRAFGEASRLFFDMGFQDEAFRVLEADLLHLMIQTPRSPLAASRTRDTLKAIDPRRWRLLRKLLFEHACDAARAVWGAE